MQSIAARIGAGRMLLLAGFAVALVLVASALTTSGKSVRERDRSQNVVSLDGTSAPAAGATASAGVADTEAAQAYVEDRSKVDHRAAIDPSKAGATADDGISPGAPSDAEVRKALRQLERSTGVPGERAVLNPDGTAEAPFSAPARVARVIAGANAIAKFPYIWGGGHGSFQDNGYDCSGSVSYALAAGGLLKAPMASGGFENYGKPGPGKWITIYANGGHMYMVVAGLRYDTSGRSGPRGTRWNQTMRPSGGFVVRHPPGL